MTAKDAAAAMTWARAMCYSLLGSEAGERLARTLPAIQVLRVWALLCRGAPTV